MLTEGHFCMTYTYNVEIVLQSNPWWQLKPFLEVIRKSFYAGHLHRADGSRGPWHSQWYSSNLWEQCLTPKAGSSLWGKTMPHKCSTT
jgi:hypothetical protein